MQDTTFRGMKEGVPVIYCLVPIRRVNQSLVAIVCAALLVLISACGEDDPLPASSNATRPAIVGDWVDAYGGRLTVSEKHFSIAGAGWGYGGSIVTVNNAAKYLLVRYTNSGTLSAGPDILGRYNAIIWKDLVGAGTTARMEYQELYAADMTNQAGDFIAWPSLDAFEHDMPVSAWYTSATNTDWHP